jgi:hypothetical protein
VAKRRNYGRNSGSQILGRRTTGRKNIRESKKTKIPAGLIFWAAFSVLITGLFIINRDQIRESLENIHLLEKPASAGGESGPGEERRPAVSPAAAERPSVVPSRPIEQLNPPPPAAGNGTATPAASPPAAGPATQPAPSAGRPSNTDQVLYFIRVNDDGEIIRSKTTRRLPASGTPLQDTLEALITGPDSAEEHLGIISLIPADTKILSATIAGNTARINFSEEFQYNTAGMEGFAAQLIQIIWTATEFPNVRDVQILIEGNRIDHLGEGIPVWNPLNRQSF